MLFFFLYNDMVTSTASYLVLTYFTKKSLIFFFIATAPPLPMGCVWYCEHHISYIQFWRVLSSLYMVLQLSFIHLKGIDLQYQTQPIDKRGTVYVKADPFSF